MIIASDYPGGNIIFKGIEEKSGYTEVFLEQNLRDTDRWWFYWNFRVDSPPSGKVRFSFCNKEVVCPYGAAVSENGVDWEYNEKGYEDGQHFTYAFDGSGQSRYFAFTLPYQLSHFERFFSRISKDSAVERKKLAVSEAGRDIPLLTFGSGKKDVVFTARHHCCETTASHALEGVISAFLGEYRSLLDEYKFHVIPFIDIDGVENGDQGKARKPHDHNLDYIEKPFYNSVKAIMEYTRKLNVVCFIDFHSPWRWGGADSRPHIHLESFEYENYEKENRFIDTLKEITNRADFDGIKYDGYITHLGTQFNPPNIPTSGNYFRNVMKSEISVTIETPYSGDLKQGYTTELLREWGENISAALFEVLK